MIITCWLLKRFGASLFFIALSLAALLSTFALLANAGSVTEEAAYPGLALLFYALLRLPGILLFVMPFAVLITSLRVFAALASHQEVVPLQTSGYSLYRIAGVFCVAVMLLGVAQFFFADRIVTAATTRMEQWQNDSYRGLPDLTATLKKPEWFSSGDYMITMRDVSADGRRLDDPTLILRDGKGTALRYYEAERANFRDGEWILKKASERDFTSRETRTHASLPVDIDLRPEHFLFLNRPPEVLRFSELMTLGSGKVETQIHPALNYRVAAWRRVAQSFGAVAMVLLAAPVGLQLTRSGRRIFFVVFALAMGFLSFVTESVLQTLGETGELPVQAAVWGTFAVFALVGGGALWRQQR